MALELWRHRGEEGPFRELARMERQMGDLFGRLFGDWPVIGSGGAGRAWAPAVDMIDRPDAVIVRADLPGMEQKDVEVTIREGTLTMQGERKEEREEKKEDEDSYYWRERAAGAFVRSMPLPPGVDAEKIAASFRNGVLEIRLPKTAGSKARKIEIKAE